MRIARIYMYSYLNKTFYNMLQNFCDNSIYNINIIKLSNNYKIKF